MRIKTVPVVSLSYGVPGPVGRFKILEDDARFFVLVGRFAPDIEITRPAAWFGAARALKPWVLVRGVIDHELGNNRQASPVRFPQEALEVAQLSVGGMNACIIRDVIAVVSQRRRVERQKPQSRDTQLFEVIQLLGKPVEVSNSIGVRVVEGTHMELVDRCIFVPEGIVQHCDRIAGLDGFRIADFRFRIADFGFPFQFRQVTLATSEI